MANSLLAHLYSRIRGSQEDIATISLQYILSQSPELNDTFTRLLSKHLDIPLPDGLRYQCQSAGEEQERPDMAGLDTAGREIVLCEMKFYAGLTPNQPLTYLKRLKAEGGQGLAFICPKARQTSLWAKLQQLCAAETVEAISPWCARVNGIPMAVITWGEVLEQLRHVASSCAVELLSDLQQLEGYCAQMDSDAFIPFRPEDLTAETAKKINRYYVVVEEVFSLLCADTRWETSGKGLRGGGNRDGYVRYFRLDKYGISFYYNLKRWRNRETIETPFWVCFENSSWKQTEDMKQKFASIPTVKKDISSNGVITLALESLLDATFDEVCEDLKQQIVGYIELLQNHE